MTATLSHRELAGGPLAGPLVAEPTRGLAAVDAVEWNRLLPPGSGALEHAYLMAWERSELPGLRSCPVLARANGEGPILAACPGYFYDLDILGVRLPALGTLLRPLRRLWPRFGHVRTYELGSPTPLTNPFLVAEAQLRPAAVEALITTAFEQAKAGRAQFALVQNFASRAVPAAQQLEQLGFTEVPMLPTAVVDLPYSSFDEYLGAMRAQYRRRARQAFKRSQELRVEHLQDFAGLAEELARLWRLIYERATEVKREVLTPAFFAAASEVEQTSVLITRRGDGSVASFALLLDDRPWLSFLHCGFDAGPGRSEGAYFRLLYEIVRVAIEGGFEQVELGMTTLEPKLDIGGVPVQLFAWVKHRSPLVQRALRALADRLSRPEQFEPRNVFKDPPPDASELVARRLSMREYPAPDAQAPRPVGERRLRTA